MNKTFLLMLPVVIVFGAFTANAQERQSSVPEYDAKDTQSLLSQSGFIALEVGNEITRDNTHLVIGNRAETNNPNAVTAQQHPTVFQERPVDITVEKIIVGNTDTGVDLNRIKSQLNQAY